VDAVAAALNDVPPWVGVDEAIAGTAGIVGVLRRRKEAACDAGG
jgi:hypothetical protein